MAARRGLFSWLVAAALGCGSVQSTSDAPAEADASFTPGPSDAARPDAATWPCDRGASFAPPVLLGNVNSSGDEFAARLTSDELTVIFSSKRSSVERLYTATRGHVDVAFGAPSPVSELADSAGAAFDGGPSLAGDGLTLLFHSSRGADSWDVFRTRRVTPAGSFAAPERLLALASPADEMHPFVVPSGDAVYFSSDRRGDFDVFRAPIFADGTVGVPVVVVTGPTRDFAPVVSADELTLYFSLDFDIARATRARRDQPFGPAERVDELNSPADDLPSWISPDGCRMYFASGRDNGQGGFDLYLAAKPDFAGSAARM